MPRRMRAYLKSSSRDSTEELDLSCCPTLKVVLPSGREVEVELFDRGTGRLTVRTTRGRIIVYPEVTNSVELDCEK